MSPFEGEAFLHSKINCAPGAASAAVKSRTGRELARALAAISVSGNVRASPLDAVGA